MARPLAVQLYSVRDLIDVDRAGVLSRLAEIGFGAIEPFRPEDDPAGLRAIADDLGLQVCAVHAGGLVRDADPNEVFDAVHTLGTTLVVVPGGIPAEEFTTADGVRRVADRLNVLAERAAAAGLRLGYHNHEHELEARMDGRHGLEAVAELLEPDVFLEVDTYWAAVGGANVPALLSRLVERIELLHVKDGPGTRDEPNVAVGTGSLPVREYLAAAPDAWRVVEFDHCATDILDALEASHTYLAFPGS